MSDSEVPQLAQLRPQGNRLGSTTFSWVIDDDNYLLIGYGDKPPGRLSSGSSVEFAKTRRAKIAGDPISRIAYGQK